MGILHFSSDTLNTTNRYSKGFTLPDLPRTAKGAFDREAALHTVLYEEYGFVNDQGVRASAVVESVAEDMAAGKCRTTTLRFTLEREGDRSDFPVHLFEPYSAPNAPTVLFINFHPYEVNAVPKYLILEELMDRGIALAHVNYLDITSDDGDFTNGIARLLTDRRDPHAAGKIALWSYALSQIATYLLAEGYARPESLYLAGHSRLGKTALLTAARDPRFQGVLVNNSGSCGAAIAREKTGETVEKICRVFPYWFNTHFQKYVDREDQMPFDQHYLGALVAPRKLCITAAEKDTWADTDAQYLMAEAASVAYEELGLTGLDRSRGLLPMGEASRKGEIAFLKRRGTHYLGREDWNFFIDCIFGR